MKKIKEIIVGTNNNGKYKEICDLLPHKIKKYSPKEFKISSPEEIGKSSTKFISPTCGLTTRPVISPSRSDTGD